MTEYSSVDDMLKNFTVEGLLDPETIAQLRGDSISIEGTAGHIYLVQNAHVSEGTVEGEQIIDKNGKVLGKEDETYQKIVRQSKAMASKDDTIKVI